MAQAQKRWAVRAEARVGGSYWLSVGDKPRKPKRGWQWHRFAVDWLPVSSTTVERFFPKRYHLPPGGGPVEIRFADEG